MSLVGRLFAPRSPLMGTLVDLRRGGSHHFLRYAFARTRLRARRSCVTFRPGVLAGVPMRHIPGNRRRRRRGRWRTAIHRVPKRDPRYSRRRPTCGPAPRLRRSRQGSTRGKQAACRAFRSSCAPADDFPALTIEFCPTRERTMARNKGGNFPQFRVWTAYLTRPSALSVSCTLGRAPTRPM